MAPSLQTLLWWKSGQKIELELNTTFTQNTNTDSDRVSERVREGEREEDILFENISRTMLNKLLRKWKFLF